DADARWRLADAYAGQGFLDKAIDSFKEAVRLKPDQGTYHHHLGATWMQVGELDAAFAGIRKALDLNPDDAGARSSLLFFLCYDPRAKQADVLAEHRRWAELHAPVALGSAFSNDRNPERVLRVGYVSPDFRGHPVGRFIEPALIHFDPTKIEV